MHDWVDLFTNNLLKTKKSANYPFLKPFISILTDQKR